MASGRTSRFLGWRERGRGKGDVDGGVVVAVGSVSQVPLYSNGAW